MQPRSFRASCARVTRQRGWLLSLLMSIVGCSRDSGPSNLTDSGGSGSGSGGGQDCGLCIDACRLEMLACAEDAVCDDILRCSDSCAAGNRRCVDACATSTPNGGANETLEKLIRCVSGKCESSCGLQRRPGSG